MQQSVTRLLAALLAAVLFLLPGCGAAGGEPEETTLVYGSGDYTSINPALYEHGEVNLLLFSGLTAATGKTRSSPGWRKSGSTTATASPTPLRSGRASNGTTANRSPPQT